MVLIKSKIRSVDCSPSTRIQGLMIKHAKGTVVIGVKDADRIFGSDYDRVGGSEQQRADPSFLKAQNGSVLFSL